MGGNPRPTVQLPQWLHYADHRLAPLRRSWRGSITPIFRWLHYGDHYLAPLRRSRNGSITAIRDRSGAGDGAGESGREQAAVREHPQGSEHAAIPAIE